MAHSDQILKVAGFREGARDERLHAYLASVSSRRYIPESRNEVGRVILTQLHLASEQSPRGFAVGIVAVD